ncbi:MAG: type IV pilus modification protein PilV [SAR86 cluster bacterium]|uniref:Type IV pilus modification protein PilV n=1 Tax=SAR86 cluster bacterium TaxID=2030880 RepID=A0A973A9K4_9GAMM|nr:type IV pilus modification protein PilV [SAR86 cluster bacterium]
MRQSIQAFTLIEVLISVLILSVGLLGASGLQLRGLDANRNAFFRTEATQLANDIANSIQVNKTTSYSDIALTTTPTVVIDCTANNCSPTQMAAYDTAQWLCSINSINATDDSTYTACSNLNIVGVLPNGKASMVKNGNEYAITVQWSDISTSTASSVNLVVVQ